MSAGGEGIYGLLSSSRAAFGAVSRVAVRPIRIKRLRREAARVARQVRWILQRSATPPRQPPVEMARHLAAHTTALAALDAELQRARESLAHLRRVEAAYCEARDVLDQREAELSVSQEELCEARDVLDQREAELSVSQEELSASQEMGHRLKAELETARRGAQAFMNFWQHVLFETEQTTDSSRSAAILVSADHPIEESIDTLVNLSEAAHGARPFQYILPFLAAPRPFPLPWPAEMPPLRIVDVGSEELAWEEDMYAPLRRVAPAEVIGFDPFAQRAGGDPSEPITVRRPDGTLVRTYPAIVADGSPVTLHVNRLNPTSSIFTSNLGLARQFGLLGTALETVETLNFSSLRLDDILPEVRVDLLKVDVQGATHIVLANAPRILANTLVCHVEADFAPIYNGERLFPDIDALLRQAGFCFVDFYSLGRQRYASFEGSPARAFHRGRTLWADCIYIRCLDTPDALTDDELYRAALIVHACYNKQDLAAELLGRLKARRRSVDTTTHSKLVVDGAPE